MKKSKTFNVGDKVFAKVKGYPAWPAKIVAANGRKYEVNFYGTDERGMIKVEDLFYYIKYKEQFWKNIKRKDYIEAVEQIEADIEEAGTDGNNDDDDDEEEPEKSKGKKRKRSDSHADGKKLVTQSDVPQVEIVSTDNVTEDTNESSNKNIVQVSRSGRIIKAKRFSEDLDDEERRSTSKRRKSSIMQEEEEIPTQKSDTDTESKVETETKDKKDDTVEVSKLEENEEVEKEEYSEEDHDIEIKSDAAIKGSDADVHFISTDYLNAVIAYAEHVKSNAAVYKKKAEEPREKLDNEVVLAKLPSGSIFGLKYGTNNPSKSTCEYDKALSDEEEARTILSLKDLVEKGDCKPEDDPNMFVNVNLPEDDIQSIEDKRKMERAKAKLNLLKVERCLVDCDTKIKCCLGLDKADPQKALEYLEQINTLTVTELMLKKHHLVVDVVKRLKRYVGNAKEWNLEGDALEIFEAQAAKIRTKADEIFIKFKSLFTIPEETSFWDAYNSAVEQFKEDTKDMKEFEVFALCHEPYSRQAFFDKYDAMNKPEQSEENKQTEKENSSTTLNTEQTTEETS